MTAALDLLAIGETMVMVTPAGAGRLEEHGQYLLRPGGAESNVAAHLAQLGLRAGWASAVGADPLGRIVTQSLAAVGVDIRLVEYDEKRPTAVYFKDPTPAGTKVYYYRRGSAASALGPEVPAHWRGQPARVVHVSGITPALSASCRKLVEAIVVDRALGDAVVAFDVNHRAALWRSDAASQLRHLAESADVVFVGRDEAESLWGTTTPDSIKELLPQPRHLVVKDGANEAVAYTPGGRFAVPARRVDNIVDVVGAGDAFAAGWLAAMLDARDETVRLQVAHFVASQVLMSPTDHAALPPIADIVALLEHNGRVQPIELPARGESVDVTDGRAGN